MGPVRFSRSGASPSVVSPSLSLEDSIIGPLYLKFVCAVYRSHGEVCFMVNILIRNVLIDFGRS